MKYETRIVDYVVTMRVLYTFLVKCDGMVINLIFSRRVTHANQNVKKSNKKKQYKTSKIIQLVHFFFRVTITLEFILQITQYRVHLSLCQSVLKGHSGAELHIYFWSTWKVYTVKYFSIAKLFLIALLRNNYLSPKCIGD